MTHIDDLTTQRANLKYIKTSMEAPLLEREKELNLARDWRDNGNEKSLHELTEAYLRLVIAISSKFKHYGLPVGDLIQEGNIGLMQAAFRFDPELGNRFSTYASWWIRASVQDYILRNWSIVRTGTTAAQKSLFFNLRRLRAQIKGQSTREFMDEESIDSIAKSLKVSTKEVLQMESRLAASDQSLNNTITNEAHNEWQDFLEDENPNPEEVVIGMRDNATRSKWLDEALGELNEREQTIIKERRLSDNSVTLETLGHELGISKERVRQIEQRALDKMRHSIQDKVSLTDKITQSMHYLP